MESSTAIAYISNIQHVSFVDYTHYYWAIRLWIGDGLEAYIHIYVTLTRVFWPVS